MKTYLHYLWFKLKATWDYDKLDILVPVWILSAFFLIFFSMPASFFFPEIAIFFAIIGLLVLIVPVPLLFVIYKIQDELADYHDWKKEDNKI